MAGNSAPRTSMFFFFLFFFILCHVFPICSGAPLAPALYVFGDSLLDSGNNNFLPTIARADYLPYGADFSRGPTGRFTNGRTVADFIAEFLGLPYAPPYLSVRSSMRLTGLNYASGSCGILPETGRTIGRCLNLGEQIDMFKQTIKSELSVRFINNPNGISKYLSESIFLCSIGSNDYLNNYMDSGSFNTSKQYNPQQFSQLLLDSLSHHLEKLYNLGARKIVVFEIGPIGCIPSVVRTHQHTGPCSNESNQLAFYFNKMLPARLSNLTSSLRGSTFVLGHANPLSYDAVINPTKYGLTDTSNPCCTTWANGTSGCIPLLNPCPNSRNHYFWDAYHLTEAVYSVIASSCIYGNNVCLPVNMKELVQIKVTI